MSYRSPSLTWFAVLLFSVELKYRCVFLPPRRLANDMFIWCVGQLCSSVHSALVIYATLSAPKSWYWALVSPFVQLFSSLYLIPTCSFLVQFSLFPDFLSKLFLLLPVSDLFGFYFDFLCFLVNEMLFHLNRSLKFQRSALHWNTTRWFAWGNLTAGIWLGIAKRALEPSPVERLWLERCWQFSYWRTRQNKLESPSAVHL